MKRKSSRQFTLFFLLLLLLCACLPTPEQEIVVNRGDNTLEELIEATAAPTEPAALDESAEPTQAPQPYEAPERVTETYSLGIGDATVVFDAPVSVPFSDHYQVYEVYKAEPSVEQVQRIIQAFFGDTPLYKGYPQMTKADFAEMLKFCDEDPSAIEREQNMIAAGEEYTMKTIIRTEMERAPLEREDVPFSLDDMSSIVLNAFGSIEARDNTYFIWGSLLDSYDLYIGPVNAYIPDERLIYYEGTYMGDPVGRRLTDLSLTREEAIEYADAFLEAAGLDWFSLSDSESLAAEWFHTYTHAEYSQGWNLVYHHTYNGVTGVNQTYGGTLAKDEYQSPWRQDTVTMYVDSNGVQDFNWYGVTDVKAVMENELQIMPFPEMLDLIKTRLKVECAYAALDQVTTVTVTNITLGYCVIPQRNQNKLGYTVPAWIVTYREENMMGGEPGVYFHDFVLDAVTGSNIKTASND